MIDHLHQEGITPVRSLGPSDRTFFMTCLTASHIRTHQQIEHRPSQTLAEIYDHNSARISPLENYDRSSGKFHWSCKLRPQFGRRQNELRTSCSRIHHNSAAHPAQESKTSTVTIRPKMRHQFGPQQLISQVASVVVGNERLIRTTLVKQLLQTTLRIVTHLGQADQA